MSQFKVPVPVTILSGFLGAGKTTFLNSMIQSVKKQGRNVFVVENEYGQENIDSQLVIGADNEIFEFSNGCLCCDLNEDLFDLLLELWKKRAEFDELIIETTGIADPATVALPFLTNPIIGGAYQLTRIVCLVDARLIESQLKETEEARKQISFSDILLITKTEELSIDQIAHVQQLLAELNPFAFVLNGNRTEGYPMALIQHFLRYEHPEQNRLLDSPRASPTHHHEGEHGHKHHHDHHHHHDITSLSFRFTECFDLEELECRLIAFLQLQAKDIYRVKGIVYAHGKKNKVILQSVAHYLGITEGRDWEKNEEKVSRIVFIGKRLKPDGFEKMLQSCFYRDDRRVKDSFLH